MLAVITMHQLFWPFLLVVGALGLIAVFFPRQFRVLAYRSSKWIDTDKVLSTMDKRVEIDRLVLRHARLFGGIVILACALLAYLYLVYGV